MSKISLKQIIENIKNEPINEMANLIPACTGLSYMLWFPCHGKAKHFRPYLKVMEKRAKEIVSVSLESPSKVLVGDATKINAKDWKKIIQFIDLNRDVLIDFYRHGMDIDFNQGERLHNRIKKVL
jgi:hypothetical protein